MFNEQNLNSEFQKKLSGAVDYVKSEVTNIRSGKTSPSLIENLMIDAYQGQSKLKLMECATITTDGPSGLLISPFDPSTIKDIEKAILASPLNISPRVQDTKIHLKFPALTEEQRLKFLKVVSSKIEEGRMRIRASRDEFRKKVRLAFDAKEISEDQKFRIEKELDNITKEYNEILEEIRLKKDNELMEV